MMSSSIHGGDSGGAPLSASATSASSSVAPAMSVRSAAALERARERLSTSGQVVTDIDVVKDALEHEFSSFTTKSGEEVDLENFSRVSVCSVKTKDKNKREDSIALPIFKKMEMKEIGSLGGDFTSHLIDERDRPFDHSSRESDSKKVDAKYCSDRNRVIIFKADVSAFMDIVYCRYELLSSIDRWGDSVEADKRGKKADNARRNRAENHDHGIPPRASKAEREAILAARVNDSVEDSSSELHFAAAGGVSSFPLSSTSRGHPSDGDSARNLDD
jgi:hypothetical protein